jgi:acyl-CoA thioesterase
MPGEAVYLPTDDPDTYESTQLANAGWYEEGQHGGAVAALVTGHVETRVPTLEPMEIARVTLELFRVVPIVPLTVRTRIVREGKRIQTVEAAVSDQSGTTLTLATVQRLRVADRPVPDEAHPPVTTFPAPAECPEITFWHRGGDKVMFHSHAVEFRAIEGSLTEKGVATVWTRIKVPVVAGAAVTPAQRAALAADFANGVSHKLDDDWVYMNSDLTVGISRYPEDEWVALSADAHFHDRGRGLTHADLWDRKGWIGQSSQTLFVDRTA